MRIVEGTPLKLLICLSILGTAISCGNKKELGRLLEEFTSQQIHFPCKMLTISFGKLEEREVPQSPTLVMYVDQSQCSECRLGRLSDYRFLLRLEEKGINVLFIFSPSPDNVKEVLEDLIRYNYPYRVWIDSQGEFAQMNQHIPNLINFHTFLLNSDNYPVFVGDPVMSDGMMPVLEKAINEIVKYKACI